jgi:hypothetical protein
MPTFNAPPKVGLIQVHPNYVYVTGTGLPMNTSDYTVTVDSDHAADWDPQVVLPQPPDGSQFAIKIDYTGFAPFLLKKPGLEGTDDITITVTVAGTDPLNIPAHDITAIIIPVS